MPALSIQLNRQSPCSAESQRQSAELAVFIHLRIATGDFFDSKTHAAINHCMIVFGCLSCNFPQGRAFGQAFFRRRDVLRICSG